MRHRRSVTPPIALTASCRRWMPDDLCHSPIATEQLRRIPQKESRIENGLGAALVRTRARSSALSSAKINDHLDWSGDGTGRRLYESRFVQALLFGINAHDPITFSAAPLVLIGVAVVACLVSAIRGSRAPARAGSIVDRTDATARLADRASAPTEPHPAGVCTCQ